MSAAESTKQTEPKYIQKIYFGSPGTGKSHTVDTECLVKLGIKIKKENSFVYEDKREQDHITTVFHPEYTYGDFMGKLVPLTKEGKVEYNFYPGHFMKALAQAYKNILEPAEPAEPAKHVALVIDEINRGNTAAIFGTVFQLLDRDKDGWSSYAISLTEIEFSRLLEYLGYRKNVSNTHPFTTLDGTKNKSVKGLQEEVGVKLKIDVGNYSIRIPPNLSIIGTMNTSDNSIYLMDSAFKRRWEWEFMDWEASCDDKERKIEGVSVISGFECYDGEYPWAKASKQNADEQQADSPLPFINLLNRFIKSHHESIRGIEDKQLGPFFIPPYEDNVSKELLINKVMFFVWDSIFQRDKKPLLDLINEYRGIWSKEAPLDRRNLVTFGDFSKLADEFVHAIMMPRVEFHGKLLPATKASDGKFVPAVLKKDSQGSKIVAITQEWKAFIQGFKTKLNPQKPESVRLPEEVHPAKDTISEEEFWKGMNALKPNYYNLKNFLIEYCGTV